MAGTYTIREDWGQRQSVMVNDLAMGFAVTDAARLADEAAANLSSLWRTNSSKAKWKRGRDQIRALAPFSAGALSLDLANPDGTLTAAGNGLQRGRLIRFAINDELAVGTLGAAISSTTATSITLTGGHGVAQWDTIEVDAERFLVTAVVTNTATVQRGAEGTTPATHSNGAAITRVNERPLATAVIDDVRHAPDIGMQMARVAGMGTLSRLRGVAPVSTFLYEDITIDEAIRIVATRAGWPDGDLILDESAVSLPYWWLTREDAYSALGTLYATEGPGAELYEDTRGRLVFKARGRKFTDAASSTSQATFRGTTTEPSYTRPFGYDDGQKHVINIAEVPLNTRVLQDVAVVFTYGQDLVLTPNEERTLVVELSDPCTNIQMIQAGTDYNTSQGYLDTTTLLNGNFATYGVNVVQASGQVVEVRFKAGPQGATITGLQLRGQALSDGSDAIVVSDIDTTLSKRRHGERRYAVPSWPVITLDQATVLSDLYTFWYQHGRPTVVLNTETGQDGTTRTQQVTREVGDRISVVAPDTALSGDYWVEAIEGEAGPTLNVAFGCEKAIGGLGIDYQYGTTQQYSNNGGTLSFNDGTYAARAEDGLVAQVTNSSGAAAVTYWLQVLLPAATRVPAGKKVTGMRVRVRCWDSVSSAATAATICGTGADHGVLAEGWTSPQGLNTAPQQSQTWTNPTNITAADASFATASLSNTAGSGAYTTLLRATNFSYSIPTGATIVGVVPEVKCKASVVDVNGNGVYAGNFIWAGLTNGGVLIGGGHGATDDNAVGSFLSTTNDWVRLTDATDDLYAATLSESIVESSTFGVLIGFTLTGTVTLSVDAVRCTVYYRVGSTLYEARAVARGLQSIANRAGGAIVPETAGYIYYGGPNDTFDGLTSDAVNGAATGAVVAFTVPNGNTLYVDEVLPQLFYDEIEDEPVSYYDTIVTQGASSFWRLNDTGAVAYDTIRTVNGTISGGVTPGQAAISETPCMRFDGASGTITMGDHDAYDFVNTTAFTVSAVVEIASTASLAANRSVVAKVNGATDGWQCIMTTGGVVSMIRRSGGAADTAVGPAPILRPRRYHLAFVYDGAAMVVYINGVAGTPVASTRSMPGNTNHLRIGSNSLASGAFWDGCISDVVIIPGALSQAQIDAHFAASKVQRAVLDTYETEVAVDAPVGWWKLGEASGTTATDSGSSPNNGTYTGAPILGVPGLLSGEARAIHLNGASQYVSIGDFHDFPGTAAFSVEIWGKLENLSSNKVLMAKAGTDGSGLQGWHMYVTSAGTAVLCRARDGSRADITGPAGAILANQPFHIVVTYDGTNIRVYTNGVVGTPGASAQSMSNTAFALEIGRFTGGGAECTGIVQQAAVYSSALSAARVAAHYAAAAGS